jgi:hypothetical protein
VGGHAFRLAGAGVTVILGLIEKTRSPKPPTSWRADHVDVEHPGMDDVFIECVQTMITTTTQHKIHFPLRFVQPVENILIGVATALVGTGLYSW